MLHPSPPPFEFSLLPFLRFCKDNHTVNLATLCLDTHVSMKKNFKNFCREKRLGVGVATAPPPSPRHEREGVAGKI